MDEALIQEQERQLQKTGRYYRHVFWLCVPLLCMACYFYGGASAAAVRRRPAYRQPVRPSGGAAAPSGVHQ